MKTDEILQLNELVVKKLIDPFLCKGKSVTAYIFYVPGVGEIFVSKRNFYSWYNTFK